MIINIKTLAHFIMILYYGLFFFNGQIIFAQKATISESIQEFITYPYSDPNPVANIGNIYPYFKFDGYSLQGKLQKWKVVTLENPYIKVYITPEIGGKIWGAMDKSTGKMFVYYNHVVKFRNIALRGPWTSGGIELNFGIIGHAPTCSTPVDYILKENNDGSVSCFVSSIDLPSRTYWSVEIKLPKDKAFFETNAIWHNPTDLNQSYYHWMNGSAAASEDLKFFFPGHSYLEHDGSHYPWPLFTNGQDISTYKENNFGTYKPYHIFGHYSDYSGGYYYNDKFGFGNWSLSTEKLGKKLWIWGLSREGMIWEDLLTDTDGQYIEIQTGRLFNQAHGHSSETPFKQRDFRPYSTDSWGEIWYPIKETEGMKAASPFGILNYEHKENKLIVYFNALQTINDSLKIDIDDKQVYNKLISLNPSEIFIDTLNQGIFNNIKIWLGKDKVFYSSLDFEKSYLSRPMESPNNFDWNSIQGLDIKAKQQANERFYEEALQNYLKCLEKDPNYLDALIGIAELYYRQLNYDTSLTYIKHALSIDTYNGAANYLYGMINRKRKFMADAKDGFRTATHNVEYRSSAYSKLAEIYAEEKNWNFTEEFAKRALDYNQLNISALQVLAITYRKQNKIEEFEKTLNKLEQLVPLNHFNRFEKYLLKENLDELKEFKKLIQGEFPVETYIELSILYFNLNLVEESLMVLNNAPSNPIVSYWKAYLYHLLGEHKKSDEQLRLAETQSAYLIFPFRDETVDVLNWVISKSKNWKGKYYLGLIYWNKGVITKSQELLKNCNNEPDFAPFYLTRGKLFEESNPSYSEKDYKYAIDLDKNEWRSWIMLSEFYERLGEYEKNLLFAENIYKKRSDDYRIVVEYANALYNFGNYKKSISILESVNILPNEGLEDIRTLYSNAHIMTAVNLLEEMDFQNAILHVEQSRLWPENLGSGKPYDPDEILADYIELFIREQTGENEKVEKLKIKLKEQTAIYRRPDNPNILMAALVLRKYGNEREALQLVKKWVEEAPNNEIARWAKSLLNNETESATVSLEKVKSKSNMRMYFSQPIYQLINK